ncbi:MAG: iron-containing alcohol dehydrogenase [Planctomycetota bacterium]|nr:iron-containing alcohol dehydrogenase [Planctomycetota bacterium]
MPDLDNVFTYESVPFKFGPGVTREIGADLERLGIKKCLVITDPHLVEIGLAAKVTDSIARSRIHYTVFDQVHSEPTDESWQEAIEAAQSESFDGFVSVGGGSAIDTTKAANLYSSHPADLFDYINKPIGKGMPVPGQLKPHIVVPTTAGTASECTSVAITDIKSMRLKTGISHRHLRPTFAILDPLNTLSCPPMVTASCGIDVLCHAAESYTAIAYDQRPRPVSPNARPPFVGSNPVSDIWSGKAIELVARFLPRAVENGDDIEARTMMMLACTYAGMGFGNAGVHIPHAMGYPIAGMVESYIPPDYPFPHPMVPHGMSVIVGAPAAFRFTSRACPERHLQAAGFMGENVENARLEEAGEILACAFIKLMQASRIPNGIGALGYGEEHLEKLVEGTLKQQRLLAQSPSGASKEDLLAIYRDSMKYW